MVIEGAFEHWPARKWSLDSLKAKAGDNKVYIRTNTNCDDYKVSIAARLQKPSNSDLSY